MADKPLTYPLLVEATQLGFYGGSRIKPGTTFTIQSPAELAKWMTPATPGARDALEALRAASPKQRGPGGVEVKAKPRVSPAVGGRRGLEPEDGI